LDKLAADSKFQVSAGHSLCLADAFYFFIVNGSCLQQIEAVYRKGKGKMKYKKNQNHNQSAGINENMIIRRLSFVGIAGNVILSAFKLFAGIVGKSGAMISDAVHSLSDVFATFIAFLGSLMSRKSADTEHPYGHERIECVASLILGIILLITGCGIGWTGIQSVFAENYEALAVPHGIALIAALVSVIAKEGMYWYTRYYAKLLHSEAFMADAWHHRSDALSSIGSFIGIGGAMLGFPVMDSAASLIICLFILKVAYDILKNALRNMLDTSCGKAYEQKLSDFIQAREGVVRVDLLNTRMFGNKVYVDLEIAVNGDVSLREAHAIAENVHDGVEKEFDDVKHIMIHVNPAQEEIKL